MKFTKQDVERLRAMPEAQLYIWLIGSILNTKLNSPFAVLALEAILKTDIPISQILECCANAETKAALGQSDDDRFLRECLTRALTWRRRQLRVQEAFARDAPNN